MMSQEDTSIKLVCLGGECVEILPDAIARSKLIQSLPWPEEVHVPFSKRDASTWHRFSEKSGNMNFSEVLSALKVADFLQDEATATSAAQSANSSLFEASRGKRTAEGRTKPFEKPSLHAVECLPGHLAQSVLRAGGRLEDWLSLLPKARPPARTALAVAAAVQHNSLNMHPIDESMCGDVLAAVKCLATPLHSLKIVSCTGRGGILNGEKVAEAILPLRQLQSLTLVNMSPSVAPRTLTELTCLRIDHSQVRSPRTRLSQCLGIFKCLKELVVIDVTFSNLSQFCKELPTLTALTSLDLRYPQTNDRQVAITGQHSAAFAEALSACTALASLTLGFPQTIREVQMGAYTRQDTTRPFLNGSVVSAIAALSSLTFLGFSGRADTKIHPRDLSHLWKGMSQLVHLSITSQGSWEGYASTLTQLTRLEHFHFCIPSLAPISRVAPRQGDHLTQALPDSLTSLKIEGPFMELPELKHLTNLRSLKCGVFDLEGQHLTSMAVLTSLNTLDIECFSSRAWEHHKNFGPASSREWKEDSTVELLSALNAECMTRLRMSGLGFPLGAVPHFERLAALQHLDFGLARSPQFPAVLSNHVSPLVELRTLTVWSDGVAAASCVDEEWRGLQHRLSQLAHFISDESIVGEVRGLPGGAPCNAH